jgi:hypothetical protein
MSWNPLGHPRPVTGLLSLYIYIYQKFAGSIPDGVMEFFIDINPTDCIMALGWTQPLAEMSTRSISWG